MRFKMLIFISLSFTFSVKAQEQLALDSLLSEYYHLATTSQDSTLYKEKFFEAFPNNFQLFDSVYGWHEIGDSLYINLLYDESLYHIDFFFELFNTIDKNVFVTKVINISLNGYSAVDAVNIFQHRMTKLFLNNTELFLSVLESYIDIEIKSFWHFFFDNCVFGHVALLKEYKKVYEEVKALSYDRILILMEEQYTHDYTEGLKRYENRDFDK